MTTLTEFLLARIAEDEAAARAAEGRKWSRDGTWYLEGVEHDVVVSSDLRRNEIAFTHPDEAEHIARHDPARVLAQCAALRAIVEEHVAWEESLYEEPAYYLVPRVLEQLASVHADHPDYREEWKP